MGIPCIFITSDLTSKQIERLTGYFDVRRGGWGLTGERLTQDELIKEAQGAQILIVGYEQVPGSVIEALSELQLIGCTRSTPVNVDLKAATSRHIPVLHTPGRNTQTAAEFTIGLILAEAHRIARSHHAVRNGRYLGPPKNDFNEPDRRKDITWNLDGKSPFKDFRGIELAGRTLGIIGFGKIGTRVALLARAFDMIVLAYSPYTKSEDAKKHGITLVDLDTLLTQADFVSLHTRVTEETSGMLGKREIGLMKPGAYLINVSRAILVDQTALIDALEERRIAGAALDVFWHEPLPANHPLLSLENVTLTPHLAGAAVDVQERHSKMIVDDILTWYNGKRPTHIANPEVWNT